MILEQIWLYFHIQFEKKYQDLNILYKNSKKKKLYPILLRMSLLILKETTLKYILNLII